MKIDFTNRTVLSDTFVDVTLQQAARLVFDSVRKSRLPKRISVTLKRLHPARLNANPTGWTDCKRRVILRIYDFKDRYPCLWYQEGHDEYPRIQLLDYREALFMLAVHEFAHIAVAAERLRNNNLDANFEEWAVENISICSLLIRRGVVTSALL